MRSVKATGGLTRGRGMTERQRSIWYYPMPACAQVNATMQQLTGVTYETSEQHKEATHARIERDCKDSMSILYFLQERNPFETNAEALQSIASGIASDRQVNVHEAETIGQHIVADMSGKPVGEYSFKRKCQAVQMSTKATVTVDGDRIHIDPQLLFQRLVTIAQVELSTEERETLFSYELSTHAPALFDSSGMLREANKPALADTLWDFVKSEMTGPPCKVQYVLDGGALLQRLPWARGKTYTELCDMYTNYVVGKYGEADVVFDGYEGGPSTKDSVHLKRTANLSSATINFSGSMVMNSKKQHFLSNPGNKQRFINMLSTSLSRKGCTTHHADGDADRLIVMTAVNCARHTDTVVIGDDTDLLIMLLHCVDDTSRDIYFKPEQRKNCQKTVKVWKIKAAKEIVGKELTE